MVKNDIFSYFNTARMRQSDRMTISSCGAKNSVNTAARPPNGSNVLSNYIFLCEIHTQHNIRLEIIAMFSDVVYVCLSWEQNVWCNIIVSKRVHCSDMHYSVCAVICLNCAKVQHYSAQVVESASERLFRVCLFRFECAIFCIAYTLCGM